MSEWNYVWAAYGLTWFVFAGYSVYLTQRVRQARRRLEAVVQEREAVR